MQNNTERNKAIALEFLDAVAARNSAALERLTALDFVWWTQGSLPSSGTYSRADYIAENKRRETLVSGTMVFTYEDVTAEADRVSVEVRSFLKLQNGKDYSNTYVYLLRLRDGLVVSAKEYLDTLYVRETMG